MDSIKAMIMAVCALSALRCIVMNTPSAEKMKSGVAAIINLILGIVMITPFAEGTIEFELPDISGYELPYTDYGGDSYAMALKAESEANITAVLEQQLQSAGINYESIETDINISADYSISISSVTIRAEDYEAAVLIIKSSLGSETEVINGAV